MIFKADSVLPLFTGRCLVGQKGSRHKPCTYTGASPGPGGGAGGGGLTRVNSVAG